MLNKKVKERIARNQVRKRLIALIPNLNAYSVLRQFTAMELVTAVLQNNRHVIKLARSDSYYLEMLVFLTAAVKLIDTDTDSAAKKLQRSDNKKSLRSFYRYAIIIRKRDCGVTIRMVNKVAVFQLNAEEASEYKSEYTHIWIADPNPPQ